MENNLPQNKKALFWLSGGHFINDIYTGVLNPIMPFIAAKIGISMAVAAVVLTISHIFSSLMQPLFGFFADNIAKRSFIFWGLILSSIFIPLSALTNNIFILFIYGMVALSVFEYIVGLFLELVFKTKYWDYSKNKFNIQGRVCLLNSFYWGILGIVFMRVIHPVVESFVVKIPDLYVYIIVGVGLVYFVIDTITSTVKVININSKLAELEKITNEIKDRIEAINARNLKQVEKIIRLRRVYKHNVLKKLEHNKKKDGILEQLRETQQEVQAKLEKRMKRLQKAFPTMKSERLSNFWKDYKKP